MRMVIFGICILRKKENQMNSLMRVYIKDGSEKKTLFYGTFDEVMEYCSKHNWAKYNSSRDKVFLFQTEMVSKFYWFEDYESCCKKRIQTYSMRELWRIIYRYCRVSRTSKYYTFGVTINKSYTLGHVRSNKRRIVIFHTAKEYGGHIPNCTVRRYN